MSSAAGPLFAHLSVLGHSQACVYKQTNTYFKAKRKNGYGAAEAARRLKILTVLAEDALLSILLAAHRYL